MSYVYDLDEICVLCVYVMCMYLVDFSRLEFSTISDKKKRHLEVSLINYEFVNNVTIRINFVHDSFDNLFSNFWFLLNFEFGDWFHASSS
jgi:hypothetical protein